MNLEKTSDTKYFLFKAGGLLCGLHAPIKGTAVFNDEEILINVPVLLKESDRYTMEDIADEKL